MEIQTIVSIIFHLYFLFVAVWSGMAIFAFLRYGQTKAFSLLITVIYLALIVSLYFRALSVIGHIA